MQKWEYLRVVSSSDSDGRILDITANEKGIFRRSDLTPELEFNLFDYLTILGRGGWEMVNALPRWGRDVVIYIFKRPLE